MLVARTMSWLSFGLKLRRQHSLSDAQAKHLFFVSSASVASLLEGSVSTKFGPSGIVEVIDEHHDAMQFTIDAKFSVQRSPTLRRSVTFSTSRSRAIHGFVARIAETGLLIKLAETKSLTRESENGCCICSIRIYPSDRVESALRST